MIFYDYMVIHHMANLFNQSSIVLSIINNSVVNGFAHISNYCPEIIPGCGIVGQGCAHHKRLMLFLLINNNNEYYLILGQ